MPRIRSIHPDACDSDKLATLSDSAERTLWRLITHTDDEGRGEDRPKLLAAKLYPLVDDKTADDVDRDLDELQQVGLLVRYQVEGRRYYCIPTFPDWQSPRHPKPSKHPAPDQADATIRRNGTANRRNSTAGVGEGVGEGVVNPLSPPAPVDDGFDRFWQQYPRGPAGKPGGDGSRKKAHAAWKRMSQNSRDLAHTAVLNYAAYLRTPDAPKPAHASTWLNQERWEQWQTPARPQSRDGPTGGRPAEIGSAEWEQRERELKAFEEAVLGDTA